MAESLLVGRIFSCLEFVG